MNEDRQERGAELVSAWERVLDGQMHFGEMTAAYLKSGGGDPNDMRSTYVDMLADIGHWLVVRGESFGEAVDMTKKLPAKQRVDENGVTVAARIISEITTALVEIGKDPDQAILMAAFHVEAELAEDEASEDEENAPGM